MNNQITPVEVFSGLMWEAEMVKNLLENENIEAFLNDEILGTLAPFYVNSGGMGSVRVIVSNTDFEKAKLVVTEYESNQKK